jgi:DHA1 family tetracycline resistance protein-like MFS transporter
MTSSTAIARPPAANLNFILVRVFITPLVGIAILGAASHPPAQDWRIGSRFFLRAAMQALAILLAGRHFRAHHE